MLAATLYQFALCPFCNKVRAGLHLKGIAFDEIEVSPRSKVELPPLPDDAPRKVPVLKVGDNVVWDSTRILAFLDEAYPDTVRFTPQDATTRARAEALEAWVDDTFIESLPPVLYGVPARSKRTCQELSESAEAWPGLSPRRCMQRLKMRNNASVR